MPNTCASPWSITCARSGIGIALDLGAPAAVLTFEPQGFQQARLQPEGSQEKGRILRPEKPARMGLESEHRRGRAKIEGDTFDLGYDCLMSPVHTVEISDRHDGAARRGRQVGTMPENRHL